MHTLVAATKRGFERHGNPAVYVPNAATTFGAEAALAGNEAGAVACKGFFKEPDRQIEEMPYGQFDRLRAADAQGGPTQDWEFYTAAAYFAAEPTEDGRLVDGSITYTILKVRRVWQRGVVVTFRLLLRKL
jgi:hypothetical protein